MTNQQNSSPLPLYILLSIGIHIIGASLFAVFTPKIQPMQSVQITLQTSSRIGNAGSVAKIQETLQPITQPVAQQPKVSQPVAQQPKVSQPVTQQPKVSQPVTQQPKVSQPVAQQPKISQPVAQQPKVSQPVTQQPKVSQPVAQQPKVSQPITQQPKISQPVAQTQPKVAQNTVQSNVVTPVQTNQQVVAQKPVSNTSHSVITNSNKDLSKELDQILSQKSTSSSSTDALADGTWGGSPRKTISFPNIVASIPTEYQNKGYGFSVTAKITFSQQGWVSAVELIQGSGDPRIDGVFRTELRKIRVEPTSVARTDTITKTFKVSVK